MNSRPDAHTVYKVGAGIRHPHDPFAIPHRYWNLFEGVDIPAPEVGAGDVSDDPHSARIRSVCELDRTPVSAEDTQRARRAYLGAIAYVDEQFGSILRVLEDTGQAEDTIVVVISDHGEMLGERGLWYKMSFFEGATRIPLIVHAPGWFAAQRVSQVDPDQLYDLSADPRELHNLAADPAHQATVDAFRTEVRARWDLNALRQRVLRSQTERRLVRDSEALGRRRIR